MLSEERLRLLLAPYLGSETEGGPVVPADLYARLASYLDLLLKWNARTNLTAIREPEEIVRRHFGESLFAGKVLESIAGRAGTLMDLGSGAGFPGIPMQLLLPGWRVALAESQGKKAAFLREAVRVLELDTEIWAGRVEDMGPEKAFDAVAMRAVDRMGAMEDVARGRLVEGGVLLRLTTEVREGVARVPVPGEVPGYVEWRRFETRG